MFISSGNQIVCEVDIPKHWYIQKWIQKLRNEVNSTHFSPRKQIFSDIFPTFPATFDHFYVTSPDYCTKSSAFPDFRGFPDEWPVRALREAHSGRYGMATSMRTDWSCRTWPRELAVRRAVRRRSRRAIVERRRWCRSWSDVPARTSPSSSAEMNSAHNRIYTNSNVTINFRDESRTRAKKSEGAIYNWPPQPAMIFTNLILWPPPPINPEYI